MRLLRVLHDLLSGLPRHAVAASSDNKAEAGAAPSEQVQLAVQLQDCFGPLLMDLPGSAACLRFGAARHWLVAARGVLLGAFLGESGATPLAPIVF
jgi:hypothetical protein